MIRSKVILLTFILLLLTLQICLAQDTFIYTYSQPCGYYSPVIDNVSAVMPGWGGTVVAMEGHNPITGCYFNSAGCYCVDNGEPEPHLWILFENTRRNLWLGAPLSPEACVFACTKYAEPEYADRDYISYTYTHPDNLPLQLRVYYGEAFSDPLWTDSGYLPDRISNMLEFPTFITKWDGNDDYNFILGGRATVDGVAQGLVVNADLNANINWVHYLPNVVHISGLVRVHEDKYLVCTQSYTWKGRLILMDTDGNNLWQYDFTNGDDASRISMFDCALLSNAIGDSVIISSQDKAQILHFAMYHNQSYTELFSLSLHDFVGAAPVLFDGEHVICAFNNDGQQIIAKYDLLGNIIWSRPLPGLGNLGKQALAFGSDSSTGLDYYQVAGKMAGGGYYFARLRASDGYVEYDTSHIPEAFKLAAYPNPFSAKVQISIDIADPGYTSVDIYNLKGQLVRQIKKTVMYSGKHTYFWDGTDSSHHTVVNGIYLIRVSDGIHSAVRKILFQK